MNKRFIAGIILTLILALLYWSELLFSAIPSLAGIPERAATIGWGDGTTRLYFIALALLDLLGGIGTVLVLLSAFKKNVNANSLRFLVTTTAIYALMQFTVAFFFPSDLRPLYWGIGVVYGIIAGILPTLTK